MDTVETVGNPNESLAPLPFTYQRVDDPSKAIYKEIRLNMIRGVNEPPRPPFTDEQIVERVKSQAEGREWYFDSYWREKGLPEEQIEFMVGDRQLMLYNFNKEISVSDEHLDKARKILEIYASKFPRALEKINWILIDNIQHPSMYGDTLNWPANGNGMPRSRAFRLLPRAMSFDPYRVSTITNFEGVFAHELTHTIDDDFENAGWKEKYKWELCKDHPDDWELRDTPDRKGKAYFNKHTGKMALVGEYPLQPEECVTEYATHNIDDDVCESVVAYLFDPDLLRSVSPGKYSIIESLDQSKPAEEVRAIRVSEDQIKLPEIKPEVIPYYIIEPSTAS